MPDQPPLVVIAATSQRPARLQPGSQPRLIWRAPRVQAACCPGCCSSEGGRACCTAAALLQPLRQRCVAPQRNDLPGTALCDSRLVGSKECGCQLRP